MHLNEEEKIVGQRNFEAVLSHAEHLEIPRDTLLKRVLFACDELSGFVHACGLVRPTGLEGLEVGVRTQATDGTRSVFWPRAASRTTRVTGPHSEPSMVPATRHW